MFSVILYGSLFYAAFKDDMFGKNLEPHAINSMTLLVRNIEYFKIQNGKYPNTMEELRTNLKEGEMVFTHDVSGPMKMGSTQREFHYEVINSGNNYFLFGQGQDGISFTQDDIFPIIDPEKDKNIGWVRQK